MKPQTCNQSPKLSPFFQGGVPVERGGSVTFNISQLPSSIYIIQNQLSNGQTIINKLVK